MIIFNALVVDVLTKIEPSAPGIPAGLQFADDINMISIADNRQAAIQLQHKQAVQLEAWVKDTDMELKASKTNCCFYTAKKKTGKQELKPYGHEELPGSMEILGGYIDKNSQLERTTAKIKR